MGYAAVNVAAGVFQRHVFERALDGVEPETVGQRGIEIVGFQRNFVDVSLVGMMVDGPHQHEAVDNHDDYHAYVLGKSEEEIPEIFRLHRR